MDSREKISTAVTNAFTGMMGFAWAIMRTSTGAAPSFSFWLHGASIVLLLSSIYTLTKYKDPYQPKSKILFWIIWPLLNVVVLSEGFEFLWCLYSISQIHVLAVVTVINFILVLIGQGLVFARALQS